MLTRLLPVLSLLTVAFVSEAHASKRHATLPGNRISLDSPCARHVEIKPDPGLHGQMVVNAIADFPEELDRLLLDTHDGVWIHTKDARCWRPTSHMLFDPTLTLVIRVPVLTPLSISESGAGNYTVGSVAGPLRLDASGALQLTDTQITTLEARVSGQAAVNITQADGDAHIDLSGAGNLTIDQAMLPSLHARLSGAGDITVARGQIDRADMEISGAGNIEVGATVGDAKADLSGMGSVQLARVTGSMDKEVSGLGTVSVGE